MKKAVRKIYKHQAEAKSLIDDVPAFLFTKNLRKGGKSMNEKIQKLIDDRAKTKSKIIECSETIEKLKAKEKELDKKIAKAKEDEILALIRENNISSEMLTAMIDG